MARYSTSTEECEIVDCFLVFQEIILDSRKVQNSVVERPVVGQLALSESQ